MRFRWLIALAVLLLLAWAGDALVARLRPPGAVSLSVVYAMPLKNGRVEYDFDHAETETCVNSLLPHGGHPPCWYARDHRMKVLCCS